MKDGVSCEASFHSKYPSPRARTRLGIFPQEALPPHSAGLLLTIPWPRFCRIDPVAPTPSRSREAQLPLLERRTALFSRITKYLRRVLIQSRKVCCSISRAREAPARSLKTYPSPRIGAISSQFITTKS